MMQVRLEPATPRSRVKHSSIEQLRSHFFIFFLGGGGGGGVSQVLHLYYSYTDT